MSGASLRVVVTGAAGFVGRALCRQLVAAGHVVDALLRNAGAVEAGCRGRVVGDISTIADWRPLLAGADAVVHLAAITHGGDLRADAAWEHYRRVNIEATLKLAGGCVECGVRRFVYMSSIKVNGERSPLSGGRPRAFAPEQAPAPVDNYGRSKYAAERALTRLLGEQGHALTLLRPPLVYGPGQRGNLQRLQGLVARGWPLPFAGLANRRSLVYVDNLAQAVVQALTRTTPGTRCYTLADVDLSTPELLRYAALGSGRRPRLFAVPAATWALLERIPPLRPWVERLAGSLVVDSSLARRELGWSPATPPDEALRRSFGAAHPP